MNAYLPNNYIILFLTGILLTCTLAIGFAITRIKSVALARLSAWLLVFASTILVECLCSFEPAGFRMLAIIGTLLYAMKTVVSVETQVVSKTQLRLAAWLSFAIGWAGMRPSIFATLGSLPVNGALQFIKMGLVRLLIGVILVLLAAVIWNWTKLLLDASVARIIATIVLLPGLSLILHFGIFNLLAGAWRFKGIETNQLFVAPLLSTSLVEFWGRRWNLAFNEMTAVGVYRPLMSLAGKPTAIVIAFLFSGILHELAISLPVKAGFGLPMFYFLIHGILVVIEKELEKRGKAVYKDEWFGRVWTIFWLVIPVPILFHKHFLTGVIWPIIGM